MITSSVPDRTSQRISRRTAALAALIGAGTVCTCWPLMFVSMIIGLTLGMPEDAGGAGVPVSVAIGVSSVVVASGALGVLLVARWLLRSSGVLRPLVVAVVGLLVAVCLYAVLNVGSRLIVSTPTGGAESLLVPLLGAAGFVLASRVSHHRPATSALALTSVVIIGGSTVATWWTG